MARRDIYTSRIHSEITGKHSPECQKKDEIVRKAEKIWSNLFQEFVSKFPDEGYSGEMLFDSFMNMINHVSMTKDLPEYRLKSVAGDRLKKLMKIYEDKIYFLEKLKKDSDLCHELDIEKKTLDSSIKFRKDVKTSLSTGRISKHSLIKESSNFFVLILHTSGFGQSDIINFIYSIFVAFKYQDYGKGGEDDIKKHKEAITESEVLQKDRIRKTFVEPVFEWRHGNLSESQ